MAFLHDLKRKLLFKLIRLEDVLFATHVKAFRLIRNRILDGSDRQDKRLQYEAEDLEAGAQTEADLEQALFTQVGKALSSWAALEEIWCA
jgi:hypothetical protein